MADEKRLPDGRRWLRWDEDRPEVCPDCGEVWEDHEGKVEMAVVDGHAGSVLPRCQDG